MKVLDVKGLNDGIDYIKKDIDIQQDQITAIQKAIRGFVSLEDSLKGKGGEAIRSFYNECHQPFLIFMYNFLIHYDQILDQVKQSVQSFEPEQNGFVRQEFLENDVEQGLKRAENVTTDLTSEANSFMKDVQDIVVLPELNQAEFVNNVQRGKSKTKEVIEQLHALDDSQTSLLESVEQELTTMKNYVADMEARFQSGDLTISNYHVKSLQGIDSYNVILDSVYQREDGAVDEVGGAAENKKPDSKVEADNGSVVSFDPVAPFDSPADVYSRGAETVAFTNTYINVRNGLAIEKYQNKSGEIKYRVRKPELLGLNKPRNGRSSKIYSKTHIDAELKRGNNLKVAQHVNAGSGASQALKSKAGWLGVAWSTGSNIYDNINNDESVSKIVGDAGVDVGLGALSLAAGGFVMSAIVGTVGAPVLVGAAAAAITSTFISGILDGVKIGEKSISDHIKSGVQSVAGWFEGIFD